MAATAAVAAATVTDHQPVGNKAPAPPGEQSLASQAGLPVGRQPARGGVAGSRLHTGFLRGRPAAPATGACSPGHPAKVPLTILHGPGGATLAFAPVTVGRKGPFLFTLDTGASQSLIDSRLARSLRLKTLGQSQIPVMGVTGQARAKIIKMTSWRAGSMPLPAAAILSLPVAQHNGPVGLLGSDILSRFHSVEVNYAQGSLTFCA